MAVKHLPTRGFGNGTLTTTVALVTLRGYVAGEPAAQPTDGEIVRARRLKRIARARQLSRIARARAN